MLDYSLRALVRAGTLRLELSPGIAPSSGAHPHTRTLPALLPQVASSDIGTRRVDFPFTTNMQCFTHHKPATSVTLRILVVTLRACNLGVTSTDVLT